MCVCVCVCVCDQNTHLQLCLERRKLDWDEFLKEQSRLKEEVDEEHAKAVGRLSAQYDEMKKDLTKYSSFWTSNCVWLLMFLCVFTNSIPV